MMNRLVGIFHANQTSSFLIHIRTKGEAGTVKRVKAFQWFLLTLQGYVSFLSL